MFSYKESGNGKTIVFLHGFVEDKSIWDNCISTLESDYHCLAIDLPGSGTSAMEKEYRSLEEVAEDLDGFLNKLEIRDFTLLGHSLGGYIALAYAKKYSPKLNGLGLIHSNAVADTVDKKSVRKRLAEALIERGSSDFLKSFFISLTSRKNYSRCKERIEEMNKIGTNLNPKHLAKWSLLMMNRPGSEDFIQETEIPMLFLFGDDDSFYSYQEGIEVASQSKQFQLSLLQNCGHAGFIEQPKEFNLEIKNYLNWVSAK